MVRRYLPNNIDGQMEEADSGYVSENDYERLAKLARELAMQISESRESWEVYQMAQAILKELGEVSHEG